jgi:hypothetical protein
MPSARPCSCAGDPPALARFDGTGLKADGYYCWYEARADLCYTDVVVFDGVGLKRHYEETTPGLYCSDVTAADFDGTGLKATSLFYQCVRVV